MIFSCCHSGLGVGKYHMKIGWINAMNQKNVMCIQEKPVDNIVKIYDCINYRTCS